MEDTARIWEYIRANHVLGLAAFDGRECRAANLFYATGSQDGEVYIMTSPDTQHGHLMTQNASVCGTISDQNPDVGTLRGIQFNGEVLRLEGLQAERTPAAELSLDAALAVYQERFPIAKKHQEALWVIRFQKIKFTDNSAGFGAKFLWERSGL